MLSQPSFGVHRYLEQGLVPAFRARHDSRLVWELIVAQPDLRAELPLCGPEPQLLGDLVAGVIVVARTIILVEVVAQARHAPPLAPFIPEMLPGNLDGLLQETEMRVGHRRPSRVSLLPRIISDGRGLVANGDLRAVAVSPAQFQPRPPLPVAIERLAHEIARQRDVGFNPIKAQVLSHALDARNPLGEHLLARGRAVVRRNVHHLV